jgi:hypothetical protein
VDSDKRCEKYAVFPIVSVARPISMVDNSFFREALVCIGVCAIRSIVVGRFKPKHKNHTFIIRNVKMKHLLAVLILLSTLAVVSCSNEPEPDIEATVAAALAATQTAAPTNTPLPPTATPEPTHTPTSIPTDTPTSTPTATATPEPTDTPAPIQSPSLASPIIETELETGDILYELPADRFSIALPQDWQAVDLEKMQLPEVLEAVGEQNENLKGLFSSSLLKNLVAAGIKFYAINLDQESLQGTIPATINILIQDLPFEPTLEMYTTLNISQLEQFFDLTSKIEQEQLMLGDLEATRITYTAKIVDPFGRTVEISNTQYLVLEGSLAYIITLSMPAELAENYLQSYSEAVETFRLIE